MKTIIIILSVFIMTNLTQAQEKTLLYNFQVMDIDGKPFDLSSLKGKKVLIVNVASKCGYTPQYAQLEALYKKYGTADFTVIGFPANNFMGQEPGSNEEIRNFCTTKYNVTFPMMAKISVKGKDMDPLYQWLTSKSRNGVLDAAVKWNFQKFMINEHGELVDFAPPGELPDSERITGWVEGK